MRSLKFQSAPPRHARKPEIALPDPGNIDLGAAPPKATGEHADLFKHISWWIETKQRMLAKNSVNARRTCPECKGSVRIVLLGPKKHMHGACETPGCIQIME
jgi:hypothetical protein